MPRRRELIAAGALWPLSVVPASAAAAADAQPSIAAGGVVVAFRHALAPGTFDPPNFALGDCATQRNLSDDGREQARRIGDWFASRSLKPRTVRSSPWCRCVDTARLAFGRADAWPALGSPRGSTEQTNEAHLKQLRDALAAASRRRDGFDVWVTHMFVLSALVGENSASGEGLVLRAGPDGSPRVIARLAPR